MASNSAFGATTGALEVAETYASNCKGKTVLITGVSKDGIGEATARAFAHGGASLIIITGRDDTRLATIKAALEVDYPNTKFLPHKLDLNSLVASRESALALLSDNPIPRIDILVANAGEFFGGTRSTTQDGLEASFGVNHMGHFVFTTTLLPKLRAASKASAKGTTRIVVVSSSFSFMSPFRFSDYNFDSDQPVPSDEEPNWTFYKQFLGADKSSGFNEWITYAQSKTANALFAVHLNRILAADGIYAFALHPGVVRSRAVNMFLETKTQEEIDAMPMKYDKDIDQGAATTMVAALDQGLSPEKGVFLSDCQVFGDVPEYVVSAEAAEKLWVLSEGIVKEKLGI